MQSKELSFANTADGRKNLVAYMIQYIPVHFKSVTGQDLTDADDMIQIPDGGSHIRLRYREMCTRTMLWFTEVSTMKGNATLG
jgi:hypothetical protein